MLFFKNIDNYYHDILNSMSATRQVVLINSLATHDTKQFLTPL